MTRPIQAVEPETLPACDSCGASGDGVELQEFEDSGDPNVGYGPIVMTLCDDCAFAGGRPA